MNQPPLRIEENGKIVSISFDTVLPHDTKLTSAAPRRKLHAAWLWHNDSRNIIVPSGQKRFSASHWWTMGKPTIIKAFVDHCQSWRAYQDSSQDDEEEEDDENDDGDDDNYIDELNKEQLDLEFYCTVKGDIHSVNTGSSASNQLHLEDDTPIHHLKENIIDSEETHTLPQQLHSLSDYVLVITWSSCHNPPSFDRIPEKQPRGSQEFILTKNKVKEMMTCASIFNMQWLKDWSHDNNDDECIVSAGWMRRMQREVSSQHTFHHAYMQALENGDDYEIHRRLSHDGIVHVEYSDVVGGDGSCGGCDDGGAMTCIMDHGVILPVLDVSIGLLLYYCIEY